MNGYITLNRGYFNHHFWREERIYSPAEAWLDLLQSARFEVTPEKILVRMNTIIINRGELRASQRYLKKRWRWSIGKVNRFLKLLEDECMIERHMEHGETIINISNYGQYNILNTKYNEHQQIQARNTDGTPTDTSTEQTKERKELSNKEKEYKEEEKLLKIRKEFYNILSKYIDVYDEKMIQEFYDYWSESNKSKTKIRWQLERTWDIEKRLKRWNNNNFNKIHKKITGAENQQSSYEIFKVGKND